jgi:hypothetical protein
MWLPRYTGTIHAMRSDLLYPASYTGVSKESSSPRLGLSRNEKEDHPNVLPDMQLDEVADGNKFTTCASTPTTEFPGKKCSHDTSAS